MCRYCDYNSPDNEIFVDKTPNDYFLNVRTDFWDEVDDDWIYERVYFISYCPYCGRRLGNDTK